MPRRTKPICCTIMLMLYASPAISRQYQILHLSPGQSTPMQDCIEVQGRAISAETVVRIKIPTGFSTAEEQSYVRFRKNGDPASDSSPASDVNKRSEDKEFSDSLPLKNINPRPQDEYDRNPFHFRTSALDGIDTRKLVKVRVYIEDKDYKFADFTPLDENDNPLIPVLGVTVMGSKSSGMFCQKKSDSISTNRGRSVLTFYVLPNLPNTPENQKIKKGVLNFVILPNNDYTGEKWGADTPILIDPKIKNDG